MHNEFLTYLAGRRLSANTIRLRRVYLGQLARTIDIKTATQDDLTAWLERPGWAPQTINCATASVRTFYDWAHRTGRIPNNPAADIRNIRIAPRAPRIASEENIHAGLRSPRLHVRAVTLLGAECGLRVHEIAKLRHDDLDGEWLTIIGKGGRQRIVHTTPELRTALRDLENPTGYYFPSRRSDRAHVDAQTVRAWILRELGTNPHSLRHRAGTSVYRGTGHDLRLTQEFLGHASPTTTARYVHIQPEQLRAASAAARIAA